MEAYDTRTPLQQIHEEVIEMSSEINQVSIEPSRLAPTAEQTSP